MASESKDSLDCMIIEALVSALKMIPQTNLNKHAPLMEKAYIIYANLTNINYNIGYEAVYALLSTVNNVERLNTVLDQLMSGFYYDYECDSCSSSKYQWMKDFYAACLAVLIDVEIFPRFIDLDDGTKFDMENDRMLGLQMFGLINLVKDSKIESLTKKLTTALTHKSMEGKIYFLVGVTAKIMGEM